METVKYCSPGVFSCTVFFTVCRPNLSGWKPFKVGKRPVQRQGPKILTSCPGFNNIVKIINNGGKVACLATNYSHCKYCAIQLATGGTRPWKGQEGARSLMSTSHLDSELDTDLEEVGHGLENNRNTAPHHDSKGPKQNKMNNLSTA